MTQGSKCSAEKKTEKVEPCLGEVNVSPIVC